MSHWIEHPSEPKELILSWQVPASVSDRLRWAVGRLRNTPEGPLFDYLREDEFKSLNLGRSHADLQALGYGGYPAFDVRNRPEGGYREQVLEAFLRRLPPSSRADFTDYLDFRVRPTLRLSPLGLLAVTEARLPSDGFSLIDPLDPAAEEVDVVLEVAGFRHASERPQDLAIGDAVELRRDPANPKDPQAVSVSAHGCAIGYVNRLQAPTVGAWLRTHTLKGVIVRLNGRPGAPRAFAFLRVRPAHSIAA